jgi:hypothetical protein
MYDKSKIVGGLLIFLGLVTFPIWFTAASGKTGYRPELQKAVERSHGKNGCVEEVEYMKHWHMDLLNLWRDEVVREGKRIYVSSDGTAHEMSLTTGCLRCHADKAQFCDKCHDYLGVSDTASGDNVYCFDCHIVPKGK